MTLTKDKKDDLAWLGCQVVGGRRSQMTSTAGNRAGEGDKTQGRQVEQTTNRNRGELKIQK